MSDAEPSHAEAETEVVVHEPEEPTEKPHKRRRKSRAKDHDKEKLKEIALRCETLPPISDEEYNELLETLVSERLVYAKSDNYEKSILYTKAINFMVGNKETHLKKIAYKNAEDKYNAQIKEVEQELADFDAETKEQLRKLAEEQESAWQKLLKLHEKENDEHVERWSSEAKTRMYNRASNQLSGLRKQARLLIQQCRFEEAELLAKSIKEMEANEREHAHLMMQRDYESSVKSLEKRHQLEEDNQQQKTQVLTRNLVQRRARLRVALENKLQKAKALKDRECTEDKIWNQIQQKKKEQVSRGKVDPDIITTRIDIETHVITDDAIISLPPLAVRRPKTSRQTRLSMNNTV